MAEFVRAQIFGTTFEITSRLEDSAFAPRGCFRCPMLILCQVHRSSAGRHGSIRSGLVSHSWGRAGFELTCRPPNSSAKDQLTGQAVAVKKIMKPFSTPVLSKRTYRELKLLKHLRHENVKSSNHTTEALLTRQRSLV